MFQLIDIAPAEKFNDKNFYYSKSTIIEKAAEDNLVEVVNALDLRCKDKYTPSTEKIAVKFLEALRNKVEVRKNNGGFVDKLDETATLEETSKPVSKRTSTPSVSI